MGLATMSMIFPNLRKVFDLIREQEGLSSDLELAKKMGRTSGSSIRNWCGDNQGRAGEVADSAGEDIITYVQSVLPLQITRAEVRKLLEGHPIYFHNALCPVNSRPWSKLLAERTQLEPLEVDLQPPALRGFQFGDAEDYEPTYDHEIGPRWRYRFAVKPPRSTGEALVLTEQNGHWVASKFTDGGLISLVSGSPWWTPGNKPDGKPAYLSNNGTLGHFRYVVIALAGTFPSLVRESLSQPLDSVTLDMLGDALLQLEPKALVVAATTMRVTDDPERLAELAEADA